MCGQVQVSGGLKAMKNLRGSGEEFVAQSFGNKLVVWKLIEKGKLYPNVVLKPVPLFKVGSQEP